FSNSQNSVQYGPRSIHSSHNRQSTGRSNTSSSCIARTVRVAATESSLTHRT
ncbi:hypothetical protein NDU88_000435, partial [Pleurodeles waltl]